MTETRRVPPGRYARSSGRLRGRALVAVGVAFAVLVGWTIWTAAVRSTPDVDAGVRGFQVLSDTAVTGTVEVHKGASTTAQCDIRSRDRYGAEAGRETVTFGPNNAGNRRTVETFTLHTSERAVTFEIQNCRLAASP